MQVSDTSILRFICDMALIMEDLLFDALETGVGDRQYRSSYIWLKHSAHGYLCASLNQAHGHGR